LCQNDTLIYKKYRVFGLLVESEIELPGLNKEFNGAPHVTIRYGTIPKRLNNIIGKGILFENNSNELILRIESVSSYLISNGDSIIISPCDKATLEEIRLFLLGSCFGALLQQREVFPLHGSAISFQNHGLVFIGKSSSGKSSLAAGFVKKGYNLLADDICAISEKNKNVMFIEPGLPHIKLWKDILEYLEYEGDLVKIRPSLEKYRKNELTNYCNIPKPIKRIIALSTSNKSDFAFTKISGTEKFNLLRENSYRFKFIKEMNLITSHFKFLSSLSNSVELYMLERPVSPIKIIELVEYIEEQLFAAK